jgi:hypothetical protein
MPVAQFAADAPQSACRDRTFNFFRPHPAWRLACKRMSTQDKGRQRRTLGRSSWWAQEGHNVDYAGRALHLRGYSSVREREPFAAVILCTADHDKADDRMRSKCSRVLRYAVEYKDLDEPLRDFIKRRGGINECASRFARRLGRGRAPHRRSASVKNVSCRCGS